LPVDASRAAVRIAPDSHPRVHLAARSATSTAAIAGRSARPEETHPSAGDDAFRRAFEAHADALRRYASRFVHSRDTVEDLLQDVFWRVWRHWRRVGGGAHVRAYLFTAMRTRALDHVARSGADRRARARYGLLALEGSADAERTDGEGEDDPPAGQVERAVLAVLEGMPPRQREVAALRLTAGMSTAAIADRLGISPRTVEVHIARATRALRAQLPGLLGR
jgi:RNA polymerase sigma factor (sigma-70 family)